MLVRPRILDRYLCREFTFTFLGVIGACAIVLLIAKVFEEFDEIIENNVSLIVAARYFFYILPYRVLEVVPLATVLAVIFSIGGLARNREMLAMTASGQSPYRSALPVLLVTLVVSGSVIALNETVVPIWQRRAKEMEQTEIQGESERARALRSDVFEKGIGNTFFMMGSFDARTNRMEDVTVIEQSDNPIVWRQSLKAKSAELVERGAAPERDKWRFERAVEIYYHRDGRPRSVVTHTKPLDRLMEADLDQYLRTRKDPEQMNLRELTRYIRTLRIRGEDVSVYVTDWYLKMVFPFSTVILGMIAFALAIRAHAASLPVAFGVGIFLTMLFYALAAVGQTLGHIGLLSPRVAAFGPPIVFLLLGGYMVRRSGFAV